MFTKFFFSWNWKLFQFQCLFLWNYYTFLFWCTYKKKKKTEKNFVSNYHHQISSWKYIIKKRFACIFRRIYIYIFHKQLTLEQKFIRRPFYTFWPQYPWHHQPPIIKFLFLRFLFCFFYHTFSFFSWFSLSHIIKAFYFHLDYRLTLDLYLFKKKCFET